MLTASYFCLFHHSYFAYETESFSTAWGKWPSEAPLFPSQHGLLIHTLPSALPMSKLHFYMSNWLWLCHPTPGHGEEGLHLDCTCVTFYHSKSFYVTPPQPRHAYISDGCDPIASPHPPSHTPTPVPHLPKPLSLLPRNQRQLDYIKIHPLS